MTFSAGYDAKLYSLQTSFDESNTKFQKLLADYNTLQMSIPATIAKERAAAITKSRSVLKGKISEEMAPLVEGWKWEISDCRFYGSPVDYVVYKGLSNNNVEEILFVDVKTNTATLSPRQKQIKKCIEEGRVSWVTFKM